MQVLCIETGYSWLPRGWDGEGGGKGILDREHKLVRG